MDASPPSLEAVPMFDINTLTTALAIALGVATWAAMTRIVGGADPVDLANLFGRPWEPSWPRGVQEEEPFHWRLDRLRQPAHARPEPRPIPALAECDECAEEAAEEAAA